MLRVCTIRGVNRYRRTTLAKRKLMIADLFCGAGGASTGVIQAVKAADFSYHMLAINHDETAIRSHSRNHPEISHYRTGLENVDPTAIVKGGRLDLLWASPSCTHHSVARGGKPRCDQQRAQPHLVLHWLEQLFVKRVIIENVPEFVNWGPLGMDGKPMKSKKGTLFNNFLDQLKILGYKFEWRVLNCADYGDATTRKRFFLQAVRGKGEIRWPEPTHFQNPAKGQKKWRSAREIIDWSIEGQSIFMRDRPLSANTIKRIAAGIKKFWGPWAKPFLVLLNSTDPRRLASTVIDVDAPFPTITTSNHLGVVEVEPFTTQLAHYGPENADSRRVKSLEEPVSVLTTKNENALVVGHSFVLPQHSAGRPRDMAEPTSTITTDGASQKVDAFMISTGGPEGARNAQRSVEDPLSSILTTDRKALIEAFMDLANNWPSQQAGRSLDLPMPTQTTSNHLGLVEAEITPPLVVQYYGNGKTMKTDKPLFTVTCRDRAGLLWRVGLDIRFRMFQPEELARAHSMGKYKFEGSKTQVVKQIGNSVPVRTAMALSMAALHEEEQTWKQKKNQGTSRKRAA